MKLNLKNILASQVNGYATCNDSFHKDQLKRITYVTAANGLFRVEKTPVALFTVLIESFETHIPGLHSMEEGIELLVPRIPFHFLHKALSFYRDVHKQDGTEASLLFFWNTEDKVLPATYSDGEPLAGLLQDGKLVVYVPRQVNTGTLSEFHMDETVSWLRNNLASLAETHSHHTMAAFFSATDDANENATQFYGVWGKIRDEEPSFAFRYCSGKTKQQISPDVLFEWPVVDTTTTTTTSCPFSESMYESHTHIEHSLFAGPFPHTAYPADWMHQHKRKYKSATGFTSRSSYDSLFGDREGKDLFDSEPLQPEKGRGMLSSKLTYFHSRHDETLREEVQNNVDDITSDLYELGYAGQIEEITQQYMRTTN